MAAEYPQEQFDTEYARFQRSADWELKNIVTALNLMPFLNTSEQWARLAAVKQIKKEREARKRALRNP